LALSDVVAHDPSLISYLVSIGIQALAVDRAQKIAGGLTVAGAGQPATQPTARPATRQQVLGLIANLLDDAPLRAAQRNAFIGERAMQIDAVRWYTSETWLLRPMFTLDAVRIGRMFDRYFAAADATGWTAAEKAMGNPAPADPLDLSRIVGQFLRSSLNRAALTGHRVTVDRRVAAIALAVRLYQLDHGQFPATLDALVPAYLPVVPADPFSPTGQPFKYLLAAKGTRPIVYSVDENGVDDTPDESVLPPFAAWGWQTFTVPLPAPRQTKPFDQYRDVSRWMPPTPPAGYLPAEERRKTGPSSNVSQ
jgi:hypothetical protein